MNWRTGMACWPGLAGIWLRGRLWSLAQAAAFSLVLNFALVTTFVWPRLITRELPSWAIPLTAWVLVLWFWVMGRRSSHDFLRQEAARSLQPDSDEQFCEAQLHYLKGHWLEAESQLLKILGCFPGDVESRLLLATVYRRSGQADKARLQLKELSELPNAAKWQPEMLHEASLLSSGNGSVYAALSGGQGISDRRAA